MTRGHPLEGAVPVGYVIVFENSMVLLVLVPAVTSSVPVVPLCVKVAETIEGVGGSVPASYPWTSAAIWLRRHSQSSAVVTSEPSLNSNGLGRIVLL